MQLCCVNRAVVVSGMSESAVLVLPAGMRATRAMQALLRVLPNQPEGGWTQASVEGALRVQGVAVNRVTVYRALDRMVQAGVLQCTVDSHRTTRYWIAARSPSAALAHLECTACHQSVPLDAGAAAVQAALHALQQAVSQSMGTQKLQLDIAVHGECASCSTGAAQP